MNDVEREDVRREREEAARECEHLRSIHAEKDSRWIQTALKRQCHALDTLKAMSPELFEAAMQPDDSFLPVTFRGPNLTPPLEHYQSPDGGFFVYINFIYLLLLGIIMNK